MVALSEQSVQSKVQAIGAIEGEEDSLAALGPEQTRDLLAAALDDFRRIDRGAIRSPPDGRTHPAVVVVDHGIHRFRLRIRGGGVVKVDATSPRHSCSSVRL